MPVSTQGKAKDCDRTALDMPSIMRDIMQPGIRIAEGLLRPLSLHDVQQASSKDATSLLANCRKLANTFAEKSRRTDAGSIIARWLLMTLAFSGAREHLWRGERLKPIGSLNSVTATLPSC